MTVFYRVAPAWPQTKRLAVLRRQAFDFMVPRIRFERVTFPLGGGRKPKK
jgi:hypothetical protein